MFTNAFIWSSKGSKEAYLLPQVSDQVAAELIKFVYDVVHEYTGGNTVEFKVES